MGRKERQDRYNELTREIYKLSQEIIALQEQQGKILEEDNREYWRLVPGRVVVYKGLDLLITEVEKRDSSLTGTVSDGRDYTKPWIKGVTRNINGEWGKKVFHCYNHWSYKETSPQPQGS
jgi:hypothetical protein